MGENKGLSAEEAYGALSDQIEYVDHKLDDAMVKIWSPGGSYTFENLPAPSAQTFRFAYEVTDDFTTDARFVEGAGIDYPAGTNVGVVNRGTDADPVYMYDVSTGAVLVDPVPTQGSTNAVSSGGTFDALNGKVDKNGTDRLMTADEGTKLEGIAAGAQVNVLESVQVNGSDLPITNKKVNVDITGKADKVTNATSGHLAGLDANGNLTDSGVSPTEEVTVEGNPVTFDSPFEQDAKSVVVSVKPIQAGSGTPSPDNIRPISGINEVEIEVSGKNKLPMTVEGIKALNTDGTWSGNTYTYNGGTVTILTDGDGIVTGLRLNGTFSAYFQFSLTGWIPFSGTYILNGAPGVTGTNLYVNNDGQVYEDFGSGINFTVTEQLVCRMVINAATFTNVDVFPMIRLASVADPTFEPYNPNSHTTTIPLPSTLYDADVDVTNGSAENRYGYIASYNGETLPGAWISDRDVYTGSNNPTIGAEVCYELATPTTISFTPADVELLEGTNVVSTNGEKVAVTYGRSLWQDIDDLKSDTEGKLDKSDVADVEGDTASKAYSVNDFMLRADGLYKVTAPIAQNASITASNTTKTTIGAVLTALLNA